MNWPNDTCDHYWEHADWLPPWYILDRWCQRDDRCRQAKYEALLSACERGEVGYGRRDSKDFDDPVRELAERRIPIIEQLVGTSETALEQLMRCPWPHCVERSDQGARAPGVNRHPRASRRLRAVFLRLLGSRSRPVQQLPFTTRTAQTRMNTGYGVESAREANRENSEERG